ncbi:uncharacterized protein JCM15063_003465 [Sporobolomyces koalae]|uniref:uncharacterized protein n=1 Tax=Sporobolomyces koalae TaxID=500713 RepID=UPI00316C4E1A
MATSNHAYDYTNFSLITTFAYLPSTACDADPLAELDRHVERLETARQTLARGLPDSWCTSSAPVDRTRIREAIVKTVQDAQENGLSASLRVRISVPSSGQPFGQSFPLAPMPDYPVKLVLDSTSTEYADDPFMRAKTTNRQKYDDARSRRGATLHPSNDPSSPPFDVVLFNPSNEVTETSISNIAFKFSLDEDVWITPTSDSGLLEGTKRAELLESGEIRAAKVTVEQIRSAVQNGTLQVICFNAVRGVFPAFIEL